MIAFRVTNTGNLELAFRSAEMRVREAVRVGVQRAGLLVLTRVKEKLSGPVLRNRTGRLRRGVNQTMQETPGRIATQVGTNVIYAARHEYGFSGTESVRAHLRTVRQAFGRPIAERKAQVRAFTRTVHAPERSFLRSSLRELTPQIQQDLRARVVAAVEGLA